MIINLKIEDKLYELYLEKYGSPKHYQKMKGAIEAFSLIPDGERVLMVWGQPRRDIEAVFQTTMDNPEKLLRLIKNMNAVQIHGVEVNFTPDELARIEMQARFHGRTTDQFIKEMVTEIKDRMLEKV